MNILLTGGTGFVGINIAEVLSEDSKNKIVIYSRHPLLAQAESMLRNMPGSVCWEQGDVQDELRIAEVMKRHQIDYIVHTSAITPNEEREKTQMSTVIRVNCLGTLNVLEAAKVQGVKRMIYVSSVAVYGDTAQKEQLVKVDSPKNPVNTYEISKYATERLCRRYASLHGMDVVSLRLGDVYGAWEYQSGVRDTMSAPCQAVMCALSGEKAKMKKPGKTGWVYGRDTALAVRALLEAGQLSSFAYNCGGAERWSLLEFCEYLKREFADFDWEIVEEDPNVTFFSETDNGLFDMERLTEDTGFIPQYGMKEGAEHYLKWMKKYPELILEVPER